MVQRKNLCISLPVETYWQLEVLARATGLTKTDVIKLGIFLVIKLLEKGAMPSELKKLLGE